MRTPKSTRNVRSAVASRRIAPSLIKGAASDEPRVHLEAGAYCSAGRVNAAGEESTGASNKCRRKQGGVCGDGGLTCSSARGSAAAEQGAAGGPGREGLPCAHSRTCCAPGMAAHSSRGLTAGRGRHRPCWNGCSRSRGRRPVVQLGLYAAVSFLLSTTEMEEALLAKTTGCSKLRFVSSG